MIQVIKQTMEERREMYKHHTNEELIIMLNERNHYRSRRNLLTLICQLDRFDSRDACEDSVNNLNEIFAK